MKKILVSFLATILLITLSIPTTILAAKPSVMTNPANSITPSSAVINGQITGNGGFGVTEYGFYWGTSSNPTTKIVVGGETSTPKNFSYNLSGLSEGTTYYFKSYATNAEGEMPGYVASFNTTAIPSKNPQVTSVSVNPSNGTINNTLFVITASANSDTNKVAIYINGSLWGNKSGSSPLVSDSITFNTEGTKQIDVYPIDGNGNELRGAGASTTVSVTALAPQKSPKITDVSVSPTSGVINSTQFTIATSTNSDTDKVAIYINGSFWGSKSGKSPFISDSLTFNTEGTKRIDVYPIDSNGNELRNAGASVIIDVTAPVPQKNPMVTGVSVNPSSGTTNSTQFVITASANSDTDKVAIYINGSLWGNKSGSSPFVSDSLTFNTKGTKQIDVYPIDGNGNELRGSGTSTTVTVTEIPVPVPQKNPQVTGVSVNPSSGTINSTQFAITASANSDTDRIAIYINGSFWGSKSGKPPFISDSLTFNTKGTKQIDVYPIDSNGNELRNAGASTTLTVIDPTIQKNPKVINLTSNPQTGIAGDTGFVFTATANSDTAKVEFFAGNVSLGTKTVYTASGDSHIFTSDIKIFNTAETRTIYAYAYDSTNNIIKTSGLYASTVITLKNNAPVAVPVVQNKDAFITISDIKLSNSIPKKGEKVTLTSNISAQNDVLQKVTVIWRSGQQSQILFSKDHILTQTYKLELNFDTDKIDDGEILVYASSKNSKTLEKKEQKIYIASGTKSGSSELKIYTPLANGNLEPVKLISGQETKISGRKVFTCKPDPSLVEKIETIRYDLIDSANKSYAIAYGKRVTPFNGYMVSFETVQFENSAYKLKLTALDINKKEVSTSAEYDIFIVNAPSVKVSIDNSTMVDGSLLYFNLEKENISFSVMPVEVTSYITGKTFSGSPISEVSVQIEGQAKRSAQKANGAWVLNIPTSSLSKGKKLVSLSITSLMGTTDKKYYVDFYKIEKEEIEKDIKLIDSYRKKALDELNRLLPDKPENKAARESRIAIINRAFDMAEFAWTPAVETEYYNNTRNSMFIPSSIYYGLPYTMVKRDYNKQKAINSGTYVDKGGYYVLTENSSSTSQLNYYGKSGLISTSVTGGIYYGNDCSSFVSMAFGLSQNENTVSILKSPNISKLDPSGKELTLNSMLPGDALIRSDHAILFLYKEGDKYVIIEQGGPTGNMLKPYGYTRSGTIKICEATTGNFTNYKPIRRLY